MRHWKPLPIALTVALALIAGRVSASSDYPDVIKAKLGLTSAPDCTLCHSDDKGGDGTIVKWFGLTMQDFGVQGKRPDLLESALDRLVDDDVDSDADGISDVEELQTGSDPNDGPGRSGGPPRPQRGCAVAVGSGSSAGSALLFALALFVRRASAWSRWRRDRASREYRA